MTFTTVYAQFAVNGVLTGSTVEDDVHLNESGKRSFRIFHVFYEFRPYFVKL